MITVAPDNADLFESGAQAIVNPVNARMHRYKGRAGLAETFRLRYPENDAVATAACENGTLRAGGLKFWRVPNGPYILNVATKDDPWEPSRYEWVESNLKAIRTFCERVGIESVACPALGAGLGKLDLEQVRALAEKTFAESPVNLIWHNPRQRTHQTPAPAAAAAPAPAAGHLDPAQDGVTHINVYSRAKTQLGRDLSNFAYAPFECEDGKFDSVEGYWYWLNSPEDKREPLRTMHGKAAKDFGRSIGAADWNDSPEFIRKIRAALRAKLIAKPQLLRDLRASTLPLKHYYVFNGVVNEPAQGRWVLDYFDEVRGRAAASTPAQEADGTKRVVPPPAPDQVPIRLRYGNASTLAAIRKQTGTFEDAALAIYVGRSNWVPDALSIPWVRELRNGNPISKYNGVSGPAILDFETDVIDAKAGRHQRSQGICNALDAVVDMAIKNGGVLFVCHCAPDPCHCLVLMDYMDRALKEHGYPVDVLEQDRARFEPFEKIPKLFAREAALTR